MVKIQKPLKILFDVRGLLHEVEEAIYFSVSPKSDEGARISDAERKEMDKKTRAVIQKAATDLRMAVAELESMNPCDFCLHNELFEE